MTDGSDAKPRKRHIFKTAAVAVTRALLDSEEDVGGYPDVERPRTRGDCEDGPRPCPFVSCRHHAYLDVLANGMLSINFPNIDSLDEIQTCTLDLASEGSMSLEQVGEALGVSRERVHQLEAKALMKLGLKKKDLKKFL